MECVVSILSYLKNNQIELMKNNTEKVRLKVLELIKNLILAIITNYYIQGIRDELLDNKKIFIFDFGEASLEYSIVKIDIKDNVQVIRIKYIYGNDHLRSIDIEMYFMEIVYNKIRNEISDKFKEYIGDEGDNENKNSLRMKIKNVCEQDFCSIIQTQFTVEIDDNSFDF